MIIVVILVEIHGRIKFLRENLGLTQKTFAEKVSVSRSTISTIESGGSKPGARLISDICTKFSVNKEWLVNGDGDMLIKNFQDVELAYLLGKFSSENSSFKKKFISTILTMTDDELKIIENLIYTLANKKD